jgi:hypothetical protein
MKPHTVLEHRFEQVLETLQLVSRLATEEVSPQRRRSWVVQYCRRCAVKERSIWDSLALYRQAGPQAILSDPPRQTIFSLQRPHVREAILGAVPAAPQRVLDEFRYLLRFGEQFLDRMGFLCDRMLEMFLQEDPWVEPYEAQLCIEVFLGKLSEELEVLGRIATSGYSTDELVRHYEDWLLDRAVVGEKDGAL